MKPKNLRRPKFSTLSDQERAILVGEICALVDSLLDLLIAVDQAPPYSFPFSGWELSTTRRPRRERQIDDDLDPTQCIPVKPDSSSKGSERMEQGVLYPLAYPLRAVWDKKIHTNRN